MSGLAKSLRIVAGLLLVSLTFAAAACSGEPGEEAAPVAVAPTTTEGASSTATETVADCRDEPVGPVTYRYADRPGVDPSRTSLDVYLPAGCGPVPVVVWVHGGGWRAGDKAFASTAPKVAWANQLGAALVAVNYRLSSPDAGVVWPDHSDDVAAGLAWIGSEGPRIGLNPSDVVLLGHSAGPTWSLWRSPAGILLAPSAPVLTFGVSSLSTLRPTTLRQVVPTNVVSSPTPLGQILRCLQRPHHWCRYAAGGWSTLRYWW
jgi:acetyl esterase/lipase